MKKFHIAIAVSNIPESIQDYSGRLGCKPCVIVGDEYALWRTDLLNFSIRKTDESVGTIRHIGWEDPEAFEFTKEKDVNGIVWEKFNSDGQLQEIRENWPNYQFNLD